MRRSSFVLFASLFLSACAEPSDRPSGVAQGDGDAGRDDAAIVPLDGASTSLDATVPSEDAGPGANDAGPTCVPVPEVCNGVDDDCDGSVDEGLEIDCLPDADGDLHAAAASPASACPDPARDAAGYCPAGLVATASSLGEDCDDTSADVFRTASVRVDADGDGYCTGAPANLCIGVAAPMGYLLSTACAASDDCRDSNSAAHEACILGGGYVTSSATKSCLGVPPTETVGVYATTSCPTGFGLSSYRAVRVSGSGSCNAISPAHIQMSCVVLEGATCRIEGDCSAL